MLDRPPHSERPRQFRSFMVEPSGRLYPVISIMNQPCDTTHIIYLSQNLVIKAPTTATLKHGARGHAQLGSVTDLNVCRRNMVNSM
jgi:hypothetical protein